jgi:nitroimidazol reductase NimA-like FMN-containing flavoprotein (pyridoxamine 5'-phosphate oxidase superfamily)
MVHLSDITEDECWALVEQSAVGRVAWSEADGPIVLPLNYVVHDGALWLRTSAHSSAAHEIDDDRVAILIDDLDPTTHVGWSVQIRGAARVHYHQSEVPEAVQGLTTWAEGPRPLWIKVEPTSIYGKRLVAD